MKSLSLLCIVGFVGAALAGCAADGSPEDASDDVTSEALGSSVSVPNPSGAYFASVIANGTGCPAGTWNAEISPDGKQFSVSFDAYDAVIGEGQALALKDCMLMIDLKTPRGLSFAVERFHWDGFANLDEAGMSAAFRPKYYFQGNPVPAREDRSDITGPIHEAVLFDDPIDAADLVWSPCGLSRRLNVQSRLLLQNNPAKTGTGSMNIDGGKLKLRWDIAWRHC
jgi:hypothetical protein